MSQHYIVGFDGSQTALAALRVGRRLAGAAGARVTAVNVRPVVPTVLAKGASAGADAALEQDALRASRAVLAELEPGAETRSVAALSPARGLHDVAAETEDALLVVGATHRGPVGRLAPGSVAERLLHGAACPVLVVPEDAEPGELRTIAVAYDGLAEAKAALDVAHRLALEHGARLVVIGVTEPGWFGELPATTSELDALVEERLRADLDAAADALPDGVEVETRLLDGIPGETIVRASRDGVDLLVCGSRGYGPIRSVIAGGVSRYVADHAPCPVLVVPRGAPVQERSPAGGVAASHA